MFVPPREDSEMEKLSGFSSRQRSTCLASFAPTPTQRERSENLGRARERKALEKSQRKRSFISIRKLKPREIHENKWFINTFNANLLAYLLEWKIEFIA